MAKMGEFCPKSKAIALVFLANFDQKSISMIFDFGSEKVAKNGRILAKK